MASTESVHRTPPAHQPSPRLVMITLIFVTLPIEVAFLATLRALGWLTLPVIFLLFSLMFFCVAVRKFRLSRPLDNELNSPSGRSIPLPRASLYERTLEARPRPRHVRLAYTFRSGRPRRPAAPRTLLRDCITARSTCSD